MQWPCCSDVTVTNPGWDMLTRLPKVRNSYPLLLGRLHNNFHLSSMLSEKTISVLQKSTRALQSSSAIDKARSQWNCFLDCT